MSLFERIVVESHVPSGMKTWATQLGGYYMGVANSGDRYLFHFEKRSKADSFVRKSESAGWEATIIDSRGKWAGVRVGVKIA